MLLFNPKCAHKEGKSLVEPGGRRLRCILREGMSEGVGQNALQAVGGSLMEADGEQSPGLKGRILRVGQVKEGELRVRVRAEPAGKEGCDGGGGSGPALHGDLVLRQREGGDVGAGVGGADGEEEAGGIKSEGCAIEGGSGDAG